MVKRAYFEGVVWLFLGVFIGIKAIRMDLGSFTTPGPGFMPFIVALALFSLSVILLVQTVVSRTEEVEQKPGFRISAFYIPCYVVAYVLLFRKVGYLVSTFLLMIFVFKSMGIEKWVWAAITALIATVLSYIFFGLILKLNLPAGIF